jgi:hypothetical protein
LGELNCSERRRRVVCGFGERGGKLQREREGHKHKERRRRREGNQEQGEEEQGEQEFGLLQGFFLCG